jgi:RNA polymerase-binding transcription factor DksA
MDERYLESATELEQARREQGIKLVTSECRPESHPDFDGEHCVRCDVEIPEARRELGYVYCVACKTLIENVNKRRMK